MSLVWGFRGAICAACPALLPPPITAGSCPGSHHHSASNLFAAIPPGLQPSASRPSLFCLLSLKTQLSSTLLIDYLLFSFPGYFPCFSLFPNGFLCALRSWLSLLWSAWKASWGPQRAALNSPSPWCFLPQMNPSWDCLHSFPRTFIILCQIRFALEPCRLLSSHRSNVISNTSEAPAMLTFKSFIQILMTKQMRILYGVIWCYITSVICFPHAHGTVGSTLVVRSVHLKV